MSNIIENTKARNQGQAPEVTHSPIPSGVVPCEAIKFPFPAIAAMKMDAAMARRGIRLNTSKQMAIALQPLYMHAVYPQRLHHIARGHIPDGRISIGRGQRRTIIFMSVPVHTGLAPFILDMCIVRAILHMKFRIA